MAEERLMIPGEPRLTRRVREAAKRGALAHAIVLSGQGDLEAAARFTAAAMQCQGTEDKPCGACPACRKVMKGVHPDVTVVRDPDHKNIAVDILRDVVADAYNLPNEGSRKIFIFPDCGLLDPKAQNLLLKVVEDGPSRAAFLFCAGNSAALLPTIRSRTVEWKLSPPQEERAESDGRAKRLVEMLCGGRAADLAAFFADLENSKISREELQGLLSDARDLLAQGLAASCGVGGSPLAGEIAHSMGRSGMSAAADTLGKFIRQCQYNIGVGHLTGALAVELLPPGRPAGRRDGRSDANGG